MEGLGTRPPSPAAFLSHLPLPHSQPELAERSLTHDSQERLLSDLSIRSPCTSPLLSLRFPLLDPEILVSDHSSLFAFL